MVGQQRSIMEVKQELLRAAETERNAVANLARAVSNACEAGYSIRDVAEITGLSKSRVDRLRHRQLTLLG